MVTMHEEGQSPEGIFDLAGNVMEWTVDPYSPYGALRSGRREEALAKEPRRVCRGGCWSSPEEDLVTTARRAYFPESQLPIIGFRCVLPVQD